MTDESPPHVQLSKKMLFAAQLSLDDSGEEVEHFIEAENIGEAFDAFLGYGNSIDALVLSVELVSGELLTLEPLDFAEAGDKRRRPRHLKIVKKEN